MSTAHNARIIEDQLSEASSHLSTAIENYKKVIAAVESAENSPAFKTPEMESMKGLLEVAHRDTSRIVREWHNHAESRAYSESAH